MPRRQIPATSSSSSSCGGERERGAAAGSGRQRAGEGRRRRIRVAERPRAAGRGGEARAAGSWPSRRRCCCRHRAGEGGRGAAPPHQGGGGRERGTAAESERRRGHSRAHGFTNLRYSFCSHKPLAQVRQLPLAMEEEIEEGEEKKKEKMAGPTCQQRWVDEGFMLTFVSFQVELWKHEYI